MEVFDVLRSYLTSSGFGQVQWPNLVMIGIGLLFIFLAIRKGFEPLLLIPIGFGILIGNIPYNAATLQLGVADGPAPRADLRYFVKDKPLTIAYVQTDGQGATRTLAPWSPLPEAYRYRAQGWIRQGKLVMVNTHQLFSLRNLPAGFTPPGIVDLGQGRQILVSKPRPDHQYPQIWSPTLQNPSNASVFYWLYTGVGLGFFPPLIFLGIGALTDFGPLLANPKTLLLGAAAQFGIFGSLLGATYLDFNIKQAASIGIIGGADGPTAIFTSSQLAPELLGAVALAAYSYMAMVPIIQPPIMKLLTTQKERRIRMKQLKPVSKRVRILFPVAGFLLTTFIAPGALPLLGMLFFGNLLRESLVTDRLAKTAQTSFVDIITILLGVTVGAKTSAANFLTLQTILIFILGIVAFGIATAAGVLFAKLMNLFCTEKINPLIGAAGVSAVPMAARVAHKLGQDEDPQNFLLMHAMGPNVAGVIGSACAAGVLLSKLAAMH